MEACKFTKISLHNNSAETKKGKNMLYTLPDSIFMNISKKTAVPMSLLEFTEVFIFQASVYKTKITIFANGNPQTR